MSGRESVRPHGFTSAERVEPVQLNEPVLRGGVVPVWPASESSGDQGNGRSRLVRRALVTSDIAAILTAYAVAWLVLGPLITADSTWGATGLGMIVIVSILMLAHAGLYTRDVRHPGHSTVSEFVPLVGAMTLVTWLVYLGALALETTTSTESFALFWGVAVTALPLGRSAARAFIRRRPSYLQNTIIIGAGDVGQLVGRKLQQHPEFGIRLVGFVDPDPKTMRTDLDGIPMIGSVDDVERVVVTHHVERAIVAFSNETHDDLLRLVRSLQSVGSRSTWCRACSRRSGPQSRSIRSKGWPWSASRPRQSRGAPES